jgi:hypothetical protein
MTAAKPLARRGPALLPMAKEASALLDKPGSDRQPFVVGYVDAEKLRRDTSGQHLQDAVENARSQIAEYAAEHQLRLGNIYVDYTTAGRSQLRTLLITVLAYNPQLVLVPSLEHLDSTGDVGPDQRTQLELIARPTATGCPAEDGAS